MAPSTPDAQSFRPGDLRFPGILFFLLLLFALPVHAFQDGKTVAAPPPQHPGGTNGASEAAMNTPAESGSGEPGGETVPESDPLAYRVYGAADDRLFGSRRGIIHPFVALREEWTDNLYNVRFDEQSNFLSVVSPGIWFSLPRLEEIPLKLTSYNGAVTGRRFFLTERDTFERFQAYLFAGLDHNAYSAESDLNHTDWQVEGLFQYSMPFGLSWRVIDRAARNRDRYDLGSFLPSDLAVEDDAVRIISTPSLIRKYTSNLAALDLHYAVEDRISLLFNYSNFFLSYDDAVNEWLDRTDNSLTFSLSYTYSPKTSLFAEYTHAFIAYDQDDAADSENMYFYGGLDWKASAKTSFIAKGGYQKKIFDQAGLEDLDAVLVEARLRYEATEKTQISLNLYKALEERDVLGSQGMDTVLASLRYDQRFSFRFAGYCEFDYERNEYQDSARSTFFGTVDEREDNRFRIKPALLYTVRDWLTAELALSYEDRNSDDDLYDFTSRTVFLALHFAL